jgi:hypothetical protein
MHMLNQQRTTNLHPDAVHLQALQLCDADEEAAAHASSSKRRRVDALLPAPGQVLRQASTTCAARQRPFQQTALKPLGAAHNTACA